MILQGRVTSGQVRLSNEHDDYVWVAAADMAGQHTDGVTPALIHHHHRRIDCLMADMFGNEAHHDAGGHDKDMPVIGGKHLSDGTCQVREPGRRYLG